MSWSRFLLPALVIVAWVSPARAETVFVEAETFTPSAGGWVVATGREVRQASGVSALHGAAGRGDATASTTVTLKEAGRYRVWVRYRSHPTLRGPFVLTVLRQDREVASAVFDREAAPEADRRNGYAWRSLDADLPAGEVVLRLAKNENKNCSGLTRHVDCILLTTDPKLVPDHRPYGRQTYLRVTVGGGYDRPVYLHVFADHYRAPWYQHYAVGKSGVAAAVSPKKGELLKAGERTAWCNITPMVYQDSGARLVLSMRYGYTAPADRLRATLEFATAPEDAAVVRTIQADCKPNGMVVIVPPDLTTPENRARLLTDRDLAAVAGKRADVFPWPTFGKKPEAFPFLIRALPEAAVDAAVTARERKTLDYFGFTPEAGRAFHAGIWKRLGESFSSPDLATMKAEAARHAAAFKAEGRTVKDVLSCRLTDEPTGQPAALLAKDPASIAAFRAWLKGMEKTPADLLVADWDAVRPVPEDRAKEFPALHYYTQRFRTRALGDFMATQRKVLEDAYGGSFPVVANFSDGAVYNANFYAQGVDYFELLEESAGQNAVWGEDWANAASTYQCGAFNVDLMRAAARKHGQPIGHFLIAYAGRLPWDVKLKAVGELARGVKTLETFHYGPLWANHEGGPPWRSTAWAAKPEVWAAHAELLREIGAAEDLLVPAKPAPAEVAILYSSASDAWTMKGNLAYGFDRMHTWLALAHAQVPVDIVSEASVAAGGLAKYKVCYLSGPNLTRAAAEKLAQWVRDGGTLWVTAGAAARDEYDRPLQTLDDLLPARRAAAADAQPFRGSGRALSGLKAVDEVTVGDTRAEVLSVRQGLDPRPGADVLGRYKDGSAALVKGTAGKGAVYCAGFLPALAYIKAALVVRAEAGEQDRDRVTRSYNPWAFPAGVRDLLLQPVRAARVAPPVACSVPVVDAVYMTADRGIVVPLANYSLRPVAALTLTIRADRPVARVESARRGPLRFEPAGPGAVKVTLPLDATDFVKLYYAAPGGN